jgi:hypothetical protein
MYLRAGKVLLSVCVLLFVTAAFHVASVQAVRSFTNEDLEKYGGRSSSSGPSDTETPQAEEERPIVPERPLRRYSISYGGGARRIIVPVTFNNRVTANMLLDTGAPGMHISYELAGKLGLLDDQESSLLVMIGGIGGSVPAVLTIMDSISVGEAEDHFIPTFISSRISDEFEGLIGMDFMANYEVRIDTKKLVVIFEELAQSSDLPAGHDERWWRSTFRQFKSLRQMWEEYRKKTFEQANYSDREKKLRAFVDRQYQKADELCDRLSVYASEHSVPLEWR